MRNLSRSKKAQFFVLSAFAIVTVIYFVGKWIEPYTIIDTSQVVLLDEIFIFNNIKEKAEEVVRISKDCNELRYNLDEYKVFVKDYALKKGLGLVFDYTIQQPCDNSMLRTSFDVTLASPKATIKSSFTATK